MGAYIDLQSLVELEYQARGFSFLPRQPIHSLLSGRHSSRIRGRGLDFAELRAYLPGDDIRTMDWHVTARMQKPFVRVFTEERDRPVLLVLDQRINMFFGSKLSTKSVTAAELAALAAWRVFHQGDRIGALIFNDSEVVEIKPQRSRSTIMRILEKTVEHNHLLSVRFSQKSNPAMLNEVFERVRRVAQHDFTILFISDFNGADADSDKLLLNICQHNDGIVAPIYDPLDMELPAAGELVASDGNLQIELQFARERMRKKLQDASNQRMNNILAWQTKLDLPVLPLDTGKETVPQIRQLLGHAVASRMHR